jgi:hypothetical protein
VTCEESGGPLGFPEFRDIATSRGGRVGMRDLDADGGDHRKLGRFGVRDAVERSVCESSSCRSGARTKSAVNGHEGGPLPEGKVGQRV